MAARRIAATGPTGMDVICIWSLPYFAAMAAAASTRPGHGVRAASTSSAQTRKVSTVWRVIQGRITVSVTLRVGSR